jgi:all-trans-retinol dehydrogenase (NAD+)
VQLFSLLRVTRWQAGSVVHGRQRSVQRRARVQLYDGCLHKLPSSYAPFPLSFPPIHRTIMASKVTTVIKEAASEPLLTGALLYALTRGPAHIRARLLAPFQNNLLAKNGVQRLATFITVLKVLTSLNVLRRVSQGLSSLALNNWTLRRSGAPFKFGPAKEELVIITGGSSGFGYEMVKSFSKVARVVVLDVQDFPPELARRELHLIIVRLHQNPGLRLNWDDVLTKFLVSGVHFYKIDVTDTPAVEDLCKQIRETHGEATVLVNNAGIGIGKTVLEVQAIYPY